MASIDPYSPPLDSPSSLGGDKRSDRAWGKAARRAVRNEDTRSKLEMALMRDADVLLWAVRVTSD